MIQEKRGQHKRLNLCVFKVVHLCSSPDSETIWYVSIVCLSTGIKHVFCLSKIFHFCAYPTKNTFSAYRRIFHFCAYLDVFPFLCLSRIFPCLCLSRISIFLPIWNFPVLCLSKMFPVLCLSMFFQFCAYPKRNTCSVYPKIGRKCVRNNFAMLAKRR